MDWILRNIPLLIILFVAISIVRAVLQAKKQQESNRGQDDDLEQQRRIREIQEQIRRKIAERRGDVPPPVLAPREERAAPAPPVPAIPPVDPFGGGGTLRRALQEIERRMQPPEPPKIESRRTELQRQYEMQDELRLAEGTQQQMLRRAANAAVQRAIAEGTESALLTTSRARLLVDLADPQSLRRAFVLREVLGPPVGLR